MMTRHENLHGISLSASLVSAAAAVQASLSRKRNHQSQSACGGAVLYIHTNVSNYAVEKDANWYSLTLAFPLLFLINGEATRPPSPRESSSEQHSPKALGCLNPLSLPLSPRLSPRLAS